MTLENLYILCTDLLFFQFQNVYKKMLTNTQLNKYYNKSHNKAFELADSNGLSVRVSKKGRIVFQIRYRYNDKPCRMSLGQYPNLTLAQARKQCLNWKEVIANGQNPIIEKRLGEKTVKKEITLKELYDEYFSYYKKTQACERTTERNYKAVDRYVLKSLGVIPLPQPKL